MSDGFCRMGDTRVELVTSCMSSRRSNQTELTARNVRRITPSPDFLVYTSDGGSSRDPVEFLAGSSRAAKVGCRILCPLDGEDGAVIYYIVSIVSP